jgi:hypothetical protein
MQQRITIEFGDQPRIRSVVTDSSPFTVQPGAAAVFPRFRRWRGRFDQFRRNTGKLGELIGKDLAAKTLLGSKRDMLPWHMARAGETRFHPIGRSDKHRHHIPARIRLVPFAQAHDDALTGNAAGSEHHPFLPAPDRLATLCDTVEGEFQRIGPGRGWGMFSRINQSRARQYRCGRCVPRTAPGRR